MIVAALHSHSQTQYVFIIMFVGYAVGLPLHVRRFWSYCEVLGELLMFQQAVAIPL